MDAAPDLISAADQQQLRRLERLIEQQRLHIAAVHPSRRAPEHRALQRLLGEYTGRRDTGSAFASRSRRGADVEPDLDVDRLPKDGQR
jgi:hypothetical protein